MSAPRVTPADLDANIVDTEIVKHVSKSGQVLRWAILTTKNGFAVTGKPSASVSPINDNAEIGEKVAVENARDDLWSLMGYALKERLDPVNIARMAHEVNRAYCAGIGDLSQLPWEDASQWQRDSAVIGATFALSADRTPEEQHDAWVADKLADGWVYGPVKDPVRKEHPCIVAYSDLPQEQRVKDYLFGAVVHTFKGN